MAISIEDFCTEEHLSKVVEVGRKTSEFASGGEIVFWPTNTLLRWGRQSGGPMLVAMKINSGVVGFLLATFHKVGIATLENLYVADGFRRQGIANKLLDELESRAMDAQMKLIRTFCHCTNVAMSHLLVARGYSEGVLTQWCVVRPEIMDWGSKGLLNKRISVRLMQTCDFNDPGYVALQDCGFAYEAPGSQCVNVSALLGSTQIAYGAFLDRRLVGLVVASNHAPTSKATIERILVAHPSGASSLAESLFLPLLRDLAIQGTSCVTAHPSIEDAGIPGLIEILVLLGFKKHRIFRAHSKRINKES